MANPFPGMDPYMEQQWGDAHARMIIYASDQLRRVLPPGLRPRVEERVFVEFPALGLRERAIIPDLRVIEHAHVIAPTAESSGGVAVAEPLMVRIADEPVTQTFIELIDTQSGNRVIALIEILSPGNKRPGQGLQQYLQKQAESMSANVNLVEIDLLRGGSRHLLLPDALTPPSHRTTYRVCVWRACKSDWAGVYALPLRDPLPTIKIPLRETDADVPLDLQALVNQAHVNGDYDLTDYREEPVPPLSAADAQWADALLRKAGKR